MPRRKRYKKKDRQLRTITSIVIGTIISTSLIISTDTVSYFTDISKPIHGIVSAAELEDIIKYKIIGICPSENDSKKYISKIEELENPDEVINPEKITIYKLPGVQSNPVIYFSVENDDNEEKDCFVLSNYVLQINPVDKVSSKEISDDEGKIGSSYVNVNVNLPQYFNLLWNLNIDVKGKIKIMYLNTYSKSVEVTFTNKYLREHFRNELFDSLEKDRNYASTARIQALSENSNEVQKSDEWTKEQDEILDYAVPQVKVKINELIQANKELQAKLVELEKERADLLENKKKLEKELEDTKKSNKELHDKIANMSSEIDSLNRLIAELESERITLPPVTPPVPVEPNTKLETPQDPTVKLETPSDPTNKPETPREVPSVPTTDPTTKPETKPDVPEIQPGATISKDEMENPTNTDKPAASEGDKTKQ